MKYFIEIIVVTIKGKEEIKYIAYAAPYLISPFATDECIMVVTVWLLSIIKLAHKYSL